MDADHTHFMMLALKEAEKGLGRTSPNPAVGAIIVKNNKIIGAGYHQKAGTNHAERNALASAAGADLSGSTMYVTLEPCNHFGRTPPCTHAILEHNISRVVVGYKDPNPTVEGGGMEYLRAHGVDVVYGILENECRDIVFPFLKHSSTGKPWVVMKAGMSLDGKISYRKNEGGKITNKESQAVTHQLRNRLDAILIGIETARIDNPSLTTRLVEGKGRDPQRVILDSNLTLSPDAKILQQDSDASTFIICTKNGADKNRGKLAKAGARIIEVDSDQYGHPSLEAVLSVLGQRDITSVLVEGGAKIHGAFFARGLIDEIHLFIAPFFIGDGGTPVIRGYNFSGQLDDFKGVDFSVEKLGQDIHCHGICNQAFM